MEPRSRPRSVSPSRWFTQTAARAQLTEAARLCAARAAVAQQPQPLPRSSSTSVLSLPPRRSSTAGLPARASSWRAQSPPPRARFLSGDGALVIASAAAYVPRRLSLLYASPTPPLPPCCAPLRAVLLFADCSGFSTLTRWMAARYEQGPWVTSRALNALFGAMTACVDAHGGDVLNFAGDALLIAWPLSDEDTSGDAAAAAAAAACSMALLRLGGDGTSLPAGVPALSLHIALHAGALSEMHVGDGDAPGGRWEHMVCGAPLSELAPLIAAAASGECIASDAVWSMLPAGAATRGAPCAGGAHMAAVSPAVLRRLSRAEPPPPSPKVLSALAAYLPPALADTLAAGEQGWLAELRRVSCLFILLPPCGADDCALASALVAEVHRVVGRHGGAPQQSIADDKGTVSLAVWGKPGLGGGADDPGSALAAARELAASLSAIAAVHGRSERIACGVTTGRAFCGNVGSATRCEWAVVGDVMNRAAALMTAAARHERPVLCDAGTARHMLAACTEAGDDTPAWLLEAVLSVALKGAAEPAPVFAPPPAAVDEGCATPACEATAAGGGDAMSHAARRGSGGAPRLVGRNTELSRVVSVLRGGGGALLVVSGGVSSGKTAFLRAAAGEVAAAGLRVYALATARGAAGAGFCAPWMTAAVRRHVGALPPLLRPLAPLLASLAPGVPIAALATPDSAAALAALADDDGAVQEALCALAVAVLAPLLAPPGEASGALLLADNACTLDARSAALLAAVYSALRPALLLSMPRTELEDPHSPGALLVAALATAAPAVHTIALGPLAPTAAAALCAAELRLPSPAALPPGLVPALMRLAGGHPLLLQESLALLLRQGHLRVAAPPAPQSLRPATADALDAIRLGSAARRVRPASAPSPPPPPVVTVACDLAALPELIACGLTEQDSAARAYVFMQRRLDNLSPEARAAVRAAAVLGGEFDLPLLARCCSDASFAAVCAAAAELQHEGIWFQVSSNGGADDGDDDSGGAVRYAFAHEVVRALVFCTTPEDTRAELHRTVLACLEDARWQAPGTAVGAPAAVRWAEWGRLARGANQHSKAAACFLAAAQASAAAPAARGLADAERHATDGLAALQDAASAAAAAAAAASRTSPVGGAGTTPPRLSRLSIACDSGADTLFVAPPTVADQRSTELHRGLAAVLRSVRAVRASWARLEPHVAAHALAMTHAFVGHAPSVLEAVHGKHGQALTDSEMGPVMVAHQSTLLRLIGTTVAGQRDLDALAPTLLLCGRMHARFGDTIRDFYLAFGAAMMDTLRGALGDDCTEDVAAAWAGVFEFVAAAMVAGIDSVAAERTAETTFVDALLGATASPARAAAVAVAS